MRQVRGISERTWRKYRSANRKAGGCFYDNSNRTNFVSVLHFKSGIKYLLETAYSYTLNKPVINVWRHGKNNRVLVVGISENVDGAISTAKVYDEWQ